MSDQAWLVAWQRRLRALSSVVELFAAGDLTYPDDAAILDRLEVAEATARQQYRSHGRDVGPPAATADASSHPNVRAAEQPAQLNAAIEEALPGGGQPERKGELQAWRGGGLAWADPQITVSYMAPLVTTLGNPEIQQTHEQLTRRVVAGQQAQAHQSALVLQGALGGMLGTVAAEPFVHEIDRLLSLVDLVIRHLTR